MSSNELPSKFDVIVVGTGLTESIVAAACSRIGKSVLHVDENPYYGSEWASFTFDQLKTWIETNGHHTTSSSPFLEHTLEDEESMEQEPSLPRNEIPDKFSVIFNAEAISYIPEDESPESSQSSGNLWTKTRMTNEAKRFCLDTCPRVR